jgi:hypothetical protein
MPTHHPEETLVLFGEYHLAPGEARRTIHAYSGSEVIWEWRGPGGDDCRLADHDTSVRPAGMDAAFAYHASVTLLHQTAEGAAPTVGHGATPLAALEDLLWRLVAPTLLADDAEPPVSAVAPAGCV